MIYTGYFAKQKKYEEQGYECVSIARKTPEWFKGDVLPQFAPSFELLSKFKNDLCTEEEYVEQYRRELTLREMAGYLNWRLLMKYLENKVLLCYESPDQFCHRHILAQVIRNRGLSCEELKIE